MRVDTGVYDLVARTAREKAISYTRALKLLLTEKQDLPGETRDEVFNLGILKQQHFVFQEIFGEEYVCAVCMEAARKKHPFLLTYARTRHCYLRGRDEVEKHFKNKHPEIAKMLDKKK